MKKNNSYNLLFETTYVVPNSDIEILYEGKTSGGSPKVAFKSRLQEANTRNGNNRRYSSKTCQAIVDHLSPRAKANALLCEIDHPLFFEGSGDPKKLKQRAAIIEVKNCAAKLKNIDFSNSEIIGELETLSGFMGPDFANLLVKDKVDIGFSLRALGAVQQLQDGTLDVQTPIHPITYDK